MTAEAVSPTPPIICPPWCIVPTAEHAAELDNWGGHVIHHSGDSTRLGTRVTVNVSSSNLPDGALSPNEVPHVWLDNIPDSLTLDEALVVAQLLVELVEEVRP